MTRGSRGARALPLRAPAARRLGLPVHGRGPAALLLGLLALCAACGGEDRNLVLVTVTGQDGQSDLVATATLGERSHGYTVKAPADRFSIELPREARGDLQILVSAVGPDGCGQLSGRGSLAIAGVGLHELPVSLAPDPEPRCRLSVEPQGEGKGVITSQPAGIACRGDGQAGDACVATFPKSTTVTLAAAPDAASVLVDWQQPTCPADRPCPLTVSAQTTVRPLFYSKICSPSGFCWEQPRPTGVDLNGVLALADDNVYAVGNAGTILRFDGKGWRRLPFTPPAEVQSAVSLYRIFARGPGDIWISGSDGVLLHSTDGQRFTPVPTGTRAALLLLGGAPDGSIYTGGTDRTLLRGGPGGFQPVELPGGTFFLRDFFAQGDARWVVGDDGYIAQSQGGGPFTRITGQTADFIAIAGRGPDDVYIAGTNKTLHLVGGAPTEQSAVGAIRGLRLYGDVLFGVGDGFYTWKGGAWQRRDGVGAGYYAAVDGPDAAHLWLAGPGGTLAASDGTAERLVPGWAPGWTASLSGVSGDDLWRVDLGGNFSHFDGAVWQPLGPRYWNTRGVFAVSKDAVFALGAAGKVWRKAENLVGPVPYTFTEDTTVPTGLAPFALLGLWGPDEDHLVVVGSDETGPKTGVPTASRGVMLRRDGGAWLAPVTQQSGAALPGLRRVLGFGQRLWAAGDRGTILRSEDGGKTWVAETIAPSDALPGRRTDLLDISGLHGADEASLYATGNFIPLLGGDLTGVVLRRRPAGQWDVVAAAASPDGGVPYQLRDVRVLSATDVWAVGGNYNYGHAMHLVGATWAPVDAGVDGTLNVVWASPAGEVWIGTSGSVLRRAPR